jgi:protoporphyrinogen oxidase
MTALLRVQYAILGAGASGLGFANFCPSDDYVILERDASPGGYCKTICQDGFTWDYSGHFLHLRDEEIIRFFRTRTDPSQLLEIEKRTHIFWKNRLIDYPFQRNIHQLPWRDALECFRGMPFRRPSAAAPHHLDAFVRAQFGSPIVDHFLRPYNEKLLQVPISELAPDALGRFLPPVTAWQALKNIVAPDNRSYNDRFHHPRKGIYYYIEALLKDVPAHRLRLNDAVIDIDARGKKLTTAAGVEVHYERLVSSAPLPHLFSLLGRTLPGRAFSWCKVLVFNFGFDRPSTWKTHWVYFPQLEVPFYRVGFYDRLFSSDRMSLYVEKAFPGSASVQADDERGRILSSLQEAGVITDQRLISEHHVLMDPAYVHLRPEVEKHRQEILAELASHGIYSIGRYGGWKYCSIEDNLIEARALSARLTRGGGLNQSTSSQRSGDRIAH